MNNKIWCALYNQKITNGNYIGKKIYRQRDAPHYVWKHMSKNILHLEISVVDREEHGKCSSKAPPKDFRAQGPDWRKGSFISHFKSVYANNTCIC